jgi:hypothetical protein
MKQQRDVTGFSSREGEHMRSTHTARVLAIVVGLFLVGGSAFAQSISDSTTAPIGAMFNVGVTVWPGIQVVGDVGVNHKDDANIGTATGGVRYVFGVEPSGSVKPFVEALAGAGFLNASGFDTETAFAWGVGGGMDIKAIAGPGLRVQVNYFHMQKYGVSINEVRLGLGLSFGNKLFRAAGGWAPSWLKGSGSVPE